ncbi:ABC transporter permease [Cryobacterium tagatosivorans]|uniref:ABC transporter permease n=1 Tax=Cryobacterium tagatosivorans TaxID=1259199 RepID=A0A4R8UI15_9MICO|nr:ABC transporter permease [Cryobacterium tagatosivorans]TFB56736.1 ABC transporter permease [Cryobacterium tagatosivorans]
MNTNMLDAINAAKPKLRRRITTVPVGGAKAITFQAVVGHRRALLGAILTAIVVLVAVVSIFWTPYDPTAFKTGAPFSPPDLAHPMGTDVYGRDILSRIMAGAQVSLTVAASAVAAAAIAGTVIGLVAGFVGGVLDLLATRIVDIMLAIPGLVFALGIVALLGPSARSVTVALAIVYTWQFARIVRSVVISVRSRSYVEAARGLDVGPLTIMGKDIFPSVLPILIVQVTTALAWGILDEASLGFLGLGVQPPNPSWGSLLIEGRQYLYDAPWLALGAGSVVVVAVLGVNFLGDGLREIVDPRSGRKN